MVMARDWRQRERSSTCILYLAALLVRYCGRGVGRVMLYPIVAYFFLTAPSARRASREFLGFVRGQRVRGRDIFRHLHTFAATLLDRLLLFTGHEHVVNVRVHNREVLERLIGDKGCLLMTAHMGSFEVLRVLGAERQNLPIRVVMDRRQGAKLEAALKRFNPGIADTIIDRSNNDLASVLQIRDALAQGCMVGMMADRVDSDRHSTMCDFMGRPAPFPLGPWLLAAALGVPVILCIGIYRGGNCYDLYVEEVADKIRMTRRNRERAAAAWAQRFADRLAQYAHEAPDNWFNFYPFWSPDDSV